MAKGPLLRCFFNGQPDLLDESLVVVEDRFVLGHLLNLAVKDLDEIRHINQGPGLRELLENSDNLIPVAFP